MPKRTGEAESEDDDSEDDEEGMMKSVDYICSLIDKEMKQGVPLERIIVGGFSQGCAIALLVGLLSRFMGRLGGVVGLSGYLPLAKKAEEARQKIEEQGKHSTKWFLTHGSRDQLVPRRVFTRYRDKLRNWEGELVEAHLYEGMGHSSTGAEIRDLCHWVETVLPDR